MKNSKGFSAIETLLIVVIVGIIGGTGWYVLHAKNNADKNLNEAVKTNLKASAKELSKSASSGPATQSPVSPAPPPATNSQTGGVSNTPGKVSGVFVGPNNNSWPNAQTTAYIGLNVSDASQVSKVEWYLGKYTAAAKPTLQHTETSPRVGTLYQYDWPIKDLAKGTYHWTARVYDKDGNYQLVKNTDGGDYVDMLVKSQ